MNARTRNQLLVAALVALVCVIAAWYAVAREAFHRDGTLAQIVYNPAAPPYLTFTFSSPLDPAQVTGTAAVLKSFAVGPSSPTGAAAAAPLLALLTAGPGGQGPVPFVPAYSPAAPTTLTTNTLPAGAAALTQPMTITGSGAMWFAASKA